MPKLRRRLRQNPPQPGLLHTSTESSGISQASSSHSVREDKMNLGKYMLDTFIIYILIPHLYIGLFLFCGGCETLKFKFVYVWCVRSTVVLITNSIFFSLFC